MKWFLIFSLFLGFAFEGQANTKKNVSQSKQTSKKTASAKSSKKGNKATALAKADDRKLEKTISFNDRLVKGKHQVPGEGIVTVENEKPVFNLLSIRSDFNDRREKERQRD